MVKGWSVCDVTQFVKVSLIRRYLSRDQKQVREQAVRVSEVSKMVLPVHALCRPLFPERDFTDSLLKRIWRMWKMTFLRSDCKKDCDFWLKNPFQLMCPGRSKLSGCKRALWSEPIGWWRSLPLTTWVSWEMDPPAPPPSAPISVCVHSLTATSQEPLSQRQVTQLTPDHKH